MDNETLRMFDEFTKKLAKQDVYIELYDIINTGDFNDKGFKKVLLEYIMSQLLKR